MKFLIADDHELFLQGLEFILKKEYPNVELVTANNYGEIFSILEKQKDFDLILTDLAMPGATWLDALNFIHQTCSDVPVIIISAVFDPEILQKTFDIGVSGYISKSFSNSLIIGAINLVLAGGMYIPPDLLKMAIKTTPQLVEQFINENEQQKVTPEENPLTPRQMDVLSCLNEGLSNKQIAYKLGLSEGTVKIHITLLMRALEVNNRLAAVREAGKRGLLDTKKE